MATSALDWQQSAFREVIKEPSIHFLGGYQVQRVIEQYPDLNFTVVADWAGKSILHTMYSAPFRDCPAVISYSDTVFRPPVIRRLLEGTADLVVCIDSLWRQRYDDRTIGNLKSAETIDLTDYPSQAMTVDQSRSTVEFTGLMRLSRSALARLEQTHESEIGSNLIDAIGYLVARGLSVEFIDAAGEWAEFDEPADIARFVLGTKADTLARLENVVTKSKVGRQVTFSVTEWLRAKSRVIETITSVFGKTTLIVRSSARTEDSWEGSLAGSHESILGVPSADTDRICEAVDSVIDSYSRTGGDDQVLVQEQLCNVSISGVVFTRVLETGAPYYRLNFDDETLSTESVTSGTGGSLRTILVSRRSPHDIRELAPGLAGLMDAVVELEELLGFDKLDIEFAVDTAGEVHIFQVRPITVDHSRFESSDSTIFNSLETDSRRFTELQSCNPFTVGKRTIFGVMPDWNPAEIIGKRPSALAYSLYRYLITDSVWANQRADFGYRDVRPHNLIVAFSGQPYVDIRASLNSFIPANIEADRAARLVDAYIEHLRDNPDLHDKLEFDVALTVLGPCFRRNAEARLPNSTEQDRRDIEALEVGLREITNRALKRLDDDIAPLRDLEQRRGMIESAALPCLHKAIALLEDCRQFGTPAFAHAARAGFVATTFLKDFVSVGVMTEEQRQEFLAGIETVTTDFEQDLLRLNKQEIGMPEFIERYGHLRPGTYDITVPSYREDADRYLLGSKHAGDDSAARSRSFTLTAELVEQVDIVLKELGIESKAAELFDYMRAAIRAREKVKFVFTKNLSRALDNIAAYGEEHGISREELANITVEDLRGVQSGALGLADLRRRIELGFQADKVSQMVELPELITDIRDMYCFEQRRSQPNFVTAGVIEAPCLHLSGSADADLDGKILFIPQADPGYDWIFVHGIAGLITQYGGANSHMAIRSAELGIPAAIGVGDKLFERLSRCRRVRLDCSARKIDVVA